MLRVLGTHELLWPRRIEPNQPFRYWDRMEGESEHFRKAFRDQRIMREVSSKRVFQFHPDSYVSWVSVISDNAWTYHYLFGGEEVRQQAKDLCKIMNGIR